MNNDNIFSVLLGTYIFLPLLILTYLLDTMSIIDHKINRVGIFNGDNLRITPIKLISQQGKQQSKQFPYTRAQLKSVERKKNSFKTKKTVLEIHTTILRP